MERSFEVDVFRRPRIHLTIDNSTSSGFPTNTFATLNLTPEEEGFVNLARASVPKLQIEVQNSSILTLATGTFGNFTLQGFSIINSSIGLIESEAVNNPVAEVFKIINTTITQLKRHALVLHKSLKTKGILLANNSFTGKCFCIIIFNF